MFFLLPPIVCIVGISGLGVAVWLSVQQIRWHFEPETSILDIDLEYNSAHLESSYLSSKICREGIFLRVLVPNTYLFYFGICI